MIDILKKNLYESEKAKKKSYQKFVHVFLKYVIMIEPVNKKKPTHFYNYCLTTLSKE